VTAPAVQVPAPAETAAVPGWTEVTVTVPAAALAETVIVTGREPPGYSPDAETAPAVSVTWPPAAEPVPVPGARQ
jgi:hypothetical protein